MKAIPQRGPYTANNAGEVASSIPGVTLMGFNAMAEAVEEATDEIGRGSFGSVRQLSSKAVKIAECKALRSYIRGLHF